MRQGEPSAPLACRPQQPGIVPPSSGTRRDRRPAAKVDECPCWPCAAHSLSSRCWPCCWPPPRRRPSARRASSRRTTPRRSPASRSARAPGSIDITDSHYTASASGETTGLVRAFTGGEGNSRVNGTLQAGQPASATYASTIASSHKTDEVQLTRHQRRRHGFPARSAARNRAGARADHRCAAAKASSIR